MLQHLHSMHCQRYVFTAAIITGVNCRHEGCPVGRGGDSGVRGHTHTPIPQEMIRLHVENHAGKGLETPMDSNPNGEGNSQGDSHGGKGLEMSMDSNPNGEGNSQEDNLVGKGLEMPMEGEKVLEVPMDSNPNGEDTSQEDNHGGKGLEMPMKGEKDLEMPTEGEKGLEMPMDERSSRKDPFFKKIIMEKAWRCPWTQIPMEKTLPKRITMVGKAWRCP